MYFRFWESVSSTPSFRYVNMKFWLDRVAFVGHEISKDGIQVNPKRDRSPIRVAKSDNSHWSEKFYGFNMLLQEICEGFLQDSSAFNQANSEKKM